MVLRATEGDEDAVGAGQCFRRFFSASSGERSAEINGACPASAGHGQSGAAILVVLRQGMVGGLDGVDFGGDTFEVGAAEYGV